MLATVIGVFVSAMVVADVFVNNWAINNFLGNGYFFVTPIAAALSANQLMTHYTFQSGNNIANLSNSGQYMANYTVLNLVRKSDAIYAVSDGDYPLTTNTTLCPTF